MDKKMYEKPKLTRVELGAEMAMVACNKLTNPCNAGAQKVS